MIRTLLTLLMLLHAAVPAGICDCRLPLQLLPEPAPAHDEDCCEHCPRPDEPTDHDCTCPEWKPLYIVPAPSATPAPEATPCCCLVPDLLLAASGSAQVAAAEPVPTAPPEPLYVLLRALRL